VPVEKLNSRSSPILNIGDKGLSSSSHIANIGDKGLRLPYFPGQYILAILLAKSSAVAVVAL
jgi:hypothetical protein